MQCDLHNKLKASQLISRFLMPYVRHLVSDIDIGLCRSSEQHDDMIHKIDLVCGEGADELSIGMRAQESSVYAYCSNTYRESEVEYMRIPSNPIVDLSVHAYVRGLHKLEHREDLDVLCLRVCKLGHHHLLEGLVTVDRIGIVSGDYLRGLDWKGKSIHWRVNGEDGKRFAVLPWEEHPAIRHS